MMKRLIGWAIAAFALFALDVRADLADRVDVFVGTVGSGNAFPGACRPFGLVQASPDVKKLVPSGYDRTCDEVIGFSNTHLNGTGNPALGDVRMMPFAGELSED